MGRSGISMGISREREVLAFLDMPHPDEANRALHFGWKPSIKHLLCWLDKPGATHCSDRSDLSFDLGWKLVNP